MHVHIVCTIESNMSLLREKSVQRIESLETNCEYIHVAIHVRNEIDKYQILYLLVTKAYTFFVQDYLCLLY